MDEQKVSMELNKGHIAFSVACFVAGCIIGAGFRSCSSKPAEPVLSPKVIHDTIKVQDSAWLAEHTKPKYVIRHDTLWLTKPETHYDSADSVCDGRVSDSIPVDIPITCYEYRDTFVTDTSRIELGIRYEGYRAKIDGIDLDYRFACQPPAPVVKKNGWGQFIGVGFGVGYGASFVGNPSGVGTIVHAAPEIGVHITYGWGYHW